MTVIHMQSNSHTTVCGKTISESTAITKSIVTTTCKQCKARIRAAKSTINPDKVASYVGKALDMDVPKGKDNGDETSYLFITTINTITPRKLKSLENTLEDKFPEFLDIAIDNIKTQSGSVRSFKVIVAI